MTETLNCFQKHTHQQKAYAGDLKAPQQNPVPTELRQELCMSFFCHSEDVNQYIPAKFQDCGVFFAKVIKREFYDMLFINAFFGQIITKKFEKKKRFSTSPNTCNNFYKIIFFSWNQHIKVFFSLDYYILLRKFVFYHVFSE